MHENGSFGWGEKELIRLENVKLFPRCTRALSLIQLMNGPRWKLMMIFVAFSDTWDNYIYIFLERRIFSADDKQDSCDQSSVFCFQLVINSQLNALVQGHRRCFLISRATVQSARRCNGKKEGSEKLSQKNPFWHNIVMFMTSVFDLGEFKFQCYSVCWISNIFQLQQNL